MDCISRFALSVENCTSRLGRAVWVVWAFQSVWAEWAEWVIHGKAPEAKPFRESRIVHGSTTRHI